MKKSILNLDGVQTLNRIQKQTVKGGKINCTIPPTTPSLIYSCCCDGNKFACLQLPDGAKTCYYV
jgi:hypothetical protein